MTRDHVPPRSLFGDSPPLNLITVLCCEACHSSTTKDDEYFKTVIVCRADLEETPAGSILPSVLRMLGRPDKVKFGRSLARNFSFAEVVTPSGLFAGVTGVMTVEGHRINQVTTRIVKALASKEFGTPLPASYVTITCLAEKVEDEKVRGACVELLKQPPTRIWEGFFAYWFRRTDEDPNTSFWLLVFFGKVWFVGITGPREMMGRAKK